MSVHSLNICTKNNMNYHIITQDNFFDAYIEDIYKLHQEANNVFWVRGVPSATPWKQTSRKVEYLGDDASAICERLKGLQPEDKLFVCWYDMAIGNAILDSGIRNDVYVYVMGGEFYAEPFWYHASWLFDPITYRYLKKGGFEGYPQVNWKRRPRNLGKVYGEICRRRAFLRGQEELYQQKLRTMRRVDYVVLPREGLAEYEFIRRLYPGMRCKAAGGIFTQNYDDAALFPSKEGSDEGEIRILVGNSADPSNNYYDAFYWLKKQIKKSARRVIIYSMLAYGNQRHRDDVIQKGDELFGESFIPVTEYRSRVDYISFLNSMDVMVMYHNRQQAVGNIMTGLTLGKPVLMKGRSPVYAMMKGQGCDSVHDVSKVAFTELDNIIQSAAQNRDGTRKVVKRIYSEERRLEYLKDLL